MLKVVFLFKKSEPCELFLVTIRNDSVEAYFIFLIVCNMDSLNIHKGKCNLCNTPGVELTQHHVVEYLDEDGKTLIVDICKNCHNTHEKYRNFLKNACGIDIDRRKNP